jgi:hypothetical protein
VTAEQLMVTYTVYCVLRDFRVLVGARVTAAVVIVATAAADAFKQIFSSSI